MAAAQTLTARKRKRFLDVLSQHGNLGEAAGRCDCPVNA